MDSLLECNWKYLRATLEIIPALFVQLAGDGEVVSSGQLESVIARER